MAANNRTQTGFQIVQRALKAIGLPVPTSIAAATDTLSVQIWSLLTELGQELLGVHQWQFKEKIHVITTDGVSLTYALPVDFVRYVDATGWNNTSRLPLQGPLTAQEWALLVARNLGGTTIALQFKIFNGLVQFYYVPTTPCTINLTYVSRGWVQDSTVPTTFKDTMENDADICLYDPRLIVSMLRWRWRRAKGFNTTDLEQEYNVALADAMNADSPGRDLKLVNTGNYPYIDLRNIPDTGIGQ